MRQVVIICILVLATTQSCRQTYLPPIVKNPPANLVIEGFINNGPDSTYFDLSTTYLLSDSTATTPITGATVTVEGTDNSKYPLAAIGNGVQIYANAHDPSNTARYFRYDYQETWKFTSPFFAVLQYLNDCVQDYAPNTISTCWHTDVSTRVILAKQYAITKAAYNWWSIMQNNTENIGSIFGVQPAVDQGNIHCLTDTAEQVVGFVSAGTMRYQRIFITSDQVFPWDFISPCLIDSCPTDQMGAYYTTGFRPVQWKTQGHGAIYIGWKTCVDCTLTGTNIQPPFWQ